MGSGRSDGGGGGGGIGGPDTGPPTCSLLITARLADVARADGAKVAFDLERDTPLVLVVDGIGFRVVFNGQTLGWLPPDVSSVINRCLEQGYRYSASFRGVTGPPIAPQTEVTLKRSNV